MEAEPASPVFMTQATTSNVEHTMTNVHSQPTLPPRSQVSTQSLSMSSLDRPMTSMSTRSMMGEQPLSWRRSAPSFSFGNGSSREQASKVFLSRAHSKITRGDSASPGPAYYLKSSVGVQVDARMRNAPATRFGTSERFASLKMSDGPGPGSYPLAPTMGKQYNSRKVNAACYGFGSTERKHVEKVFLSHEHTSVNLATESPGPTYELNSSFGKQPLSSKHTPPSFGLGSQQRFEYDYIKRAQKSPGPGAYDSRPSSVGRQLTSSHSSSAAFGFGSSSREHQARRFISYEHSATTSRGVHSPPPVYKVQGGVGKQLLSHNQSLPSFSFPQGNRWSQRKKPVEGTPGPGSYCI